MENKINGINYHMSKAMFDALLKGQAGEKKGNPYQYVMYVLNTEFNLKGEVTHITVE